MQAEEYLHAFLEQQILMEWIVLSRDIAKKAQHHKRDLPTFSLFFNRFCA